MDDKLLRKKGLFGPKMNYVIQTEQSIIIKMKPKILNSKTKLLL